MSGKFSGALRLAPVIAAAAMIAQPLAAQEASGSDAGRYRPADSMERGLWLQVEELERDVRTSPMVIRDPALNAYVRSVLCRVVGEEKCRDVRIYVMRTAQFNATMAPNGMMQVWSGLLLRTQNEAQLAAILGHEFTHFENRHSVRLFREAKSKSDTAGFLNIIPFGGIVSLGLLTSIFSFSREMEREADMGGFRLIADAGYDTREAAVVWERLRAEMDATAAARGRSSRKDKNGGLFATHPPSAERVEYLREAAAQSPGVGGSTGYASFQEAMKTHWPDFVEDQLKLNDFGASEYLLTSLAGGNGWTPWLNYARGELYRRRAKDGDLEQAVEVYSQAIADGGQLPELWRGRGLVQLKLGREEAARSDISEYLRRAPAAIDAPMMAMILGEAK